MRLAFFVGDIIQSYEKNLMKVLMEEIKERGHQLDVFANCCTPAGDFLHIEGLKKVFYLSDLDNYDGIITADDTLHNYGINQDLRKHIKENAKCPVVCLRNSVDGCYNVVIDDGFEMYNMTKHIIDVHGCTDIGFVTGTPDLDDSRVRLEGFMLAMLESNLEVNVDEDIFNGNYWNDQGDITADFFINRKKGLPQAIICSNDYMAIALIEALMKRGISCPEDVIITGLDNIPESEENIPALTTIDFDYHAMVDGAIELIEILVTLANKDTPDSEIEARLKKREMLRNIKFSGRTLKVPGKCLFRSSCGCQDMMNGIVEKYKFINTLMNEEHAYALQCIYINMDFGGILDEEECIKTALRLLRATDRYEKLFVVTGDRLFAEMGGDQKLRIHSSPDENIFGDARDYFTGIREGPVTNRVDNVKVIIDVQRDTESILANSRYPVSKERESELEGKCNVFFPINYQDELFGYFVIQLKEDSDCFFDPVTAQMLILVGSTFKKLELLSYKGELSSIKTLYQQDPMTGLSNRRGLEKNIRELYDMNLEGYDFIVSSVDMDGLKYINDNFGHIEGDRAIKAVSDCIKGVLREGEFAARVGGDEFTIIFLQHPGEKITDFRDKLYDSVKERLSDFPDYPFSISVGLAKVNSIKELLNALKEADSDMYKEKQLHHELLKH